ncbi:MAG TPA: RNB domain-containing ribonuclease [Casimicrobiaceae bacterium]|nr:RNB domain-containing ribonuclease [Casimicrobiaceae bacterium]
MHVLFEDDGQLKAGTVLADNDVSLQVEAASGKRLKVKAAAVLLRFANPAPAALLADAQRVAAELDPNFLWEVCPDEEFGFGELAEDYFGRTPAAGEAAAVAVALAAAPMYFYKRGKGRYRKAPPEALKAALASVDRKKRESEQLALWRDELLAHRLPDALRARLSMLLYKPDRGALEWKALAAACDIARSTPLALLAQCGAIPSSHDYHFNAFLAQAFPNGTGFGAYGELADVPELPIAQAPAFSIDDASTTEIDDAFSVRTLANGNLEVGIHIAAPALVIPRGSPLDAIARTRLSTVYMPGRKITMLPEAVVAAFTLAEGRLVPSLSLYAETTPDGALVRHATRVERVSIAANLRLDAIGDTFANDASPSEPPWTEELRALWRFARWLASERGKSDAPRVDYSFYVDWDAPSATGDSGRVRIVPRPRASPLDKLVSELMIFVNSRWGRLLADARVAGLYRTQSNGKVKMSTRPGEHQGLGLAHYLWASSPLRRYCDLLNQRQLLAVISGTKPPYAENDAELFAALADFEATYSAYAEFQGRMEHYWCLRSLLQEGVAETPGTVIRENLVRFDRLPLIVRLPGMPTLAPDTGVRIAVGRIDLIEATFESRYLGKIDADSVV